MRTVVRVEDQQPSVLAQWQGARAEIWIFDLTFRRLALLLTKAEVNDILYVTGIGCRYITGPFRWDNARLSIAPSDTTRSNITGNPLPVGVAPEFGTRSTTNAPPPPSVTLFVPAATGFASEVVKAGHEIKTIPEAGAPSARYTVSLTRVVAGAPSAAFAGIAIAPHQTSNTESRPKKAAPLGGAAHPTCLPPVTDPSIPNQ